MTTDDKHRVLEAFRALLHARLDATAAITAAARDEATSAESRPENKYDTRALEASYLAAGQGERLGALRHLVSWLDAVTADAHRSAGSGTLLRLADDDDRERLVLLGPQGGERVLTEGQEVELIGVDSPLGRALRGLQEDDEAEVETPRGPRSWTILALT